MWGSWYGAAAIAGVAALVLVASAFFAWALLPIAIALFAIAGFGAYHAIKGGREETGAGSAGNEGLATPEDEPEHKPHRAGEGAGGFWGEKREA